MWYELFRVCAFSYVTKRQKKAKGLKENRALVIELAKWGNNLNRVAKHLNAERRGVDRVALEMLKRIERSI